MNGLLIYQSMAETSVYINEIRDKTRGKTKGKTADKLQGATKQQGQTAATINSSI